MGNGMTEQATCTICGEPMPPGEEMFKFHGYSGPCPKPPLAPAPLRQDFKAYLDECIGDFADDPGISWDEALLVLDAKMAEMRAELKRNE